MADGLDPGGVGRVIEPGEPIVQGGEPDPGPGGLTLGPFVSVDTEFGVVGKVGAELDEERAEVGVDGVDVEVVDQPRGLDDPRIGPAVGVAAFLGPEQVGLLLSAADEQHPLGMPGSFEPGQILMGNIVLTFTFDEIDPWQ